MTATARSIRPYVARDSGRGLAACLADVNRNNFRCYGADLRYGWSAGRLVVDSLVQYDHLIRHLASLPHVEFVPHTELFARGSVPDKVLCSIRHDVDADPRAAVAEAEIEHRHGARTSYYILHTAPYYGTFHRGTFLRHGCMAILYRRIQDLGHEIALHTDPLWIYQDLRIDGAQAVTEELAWLRHEGLRITGSVAHNSAPVYGIENFAIFKGRNRRGLGHDAADTPVEYLDEIIHRDKWAPLGVLDEAALGLTYEGNDMFHQRVAPLAYGATRRLNRWRWNAHLARLRDRPDPDEDQFIDQDRLLADLETVPLGHWLVLNVHPLYYGARHDETAAPAVRVDRRRTIVNPDVGWETLEPHSLVAASGETGGRQEFQSVNFADDTGFIDAPPLHDPDDPTLLRGLVLGGTNLHGDTVGFTEHAHRQAASRLAEHRAQPVWFRAMAHPGMGFTRTFAWFRAAAAAVRPHVVIVGLGADVLATAVPSRWMVATGFAPSHPPGDHLWADASGAVTVHDASPGAEIRRARPRDVEAPNLTQPDRAAAHTDDLARLAACLRFLTDEIRALGAKPVLLVEECGESVGLWNPDVDDDTRRAAHHRAVQALRTLAETADAPLVDPYPAMLDQARRWPAHWRSRAAWNFTGHRLAATALLHTLRAITP